MITKADPTYSGALSECLKRFPADQHAAVTRRWYRAQMRDWALFWRQARLYAAMLGVPVHEVNSTAVNLAKNYRDEARRIA